MLKSESNAQDPNLNLKSYDRVRSTLNVQRVDKPNVSRLSSHHHRMRSLARAKEPHALQQRAISHTGRRKNNLPSRRQIVGVVNLVRVR